MNKYISLSLILFFLGCVFQKESVNKDIFMDTHNDLIMGAEDSTDMIMGAPTVTQLAHALALAEEVIDSLNSIVSRLEWKLFEAKYPIQARKLVLESEGWKVYVVKAGDTLSGISYRLKDTLDYASIWELNKDTIKNPNMLNIGDLLKIESIN